MATNKETEIKVPLRLIINLVDCIEAQQNLANSNIDVVGKQQMQKLVKNTTDWANSIITSSLNGNNEPSANLQETLDFVQTDKRTSISVGSCDVENESSCTMIVEPDNSEGGFI